MLPSRKEVVTWSIIRPVLTPPTRLLGSTSPFESRLVSNRRCRNSSGKDFCSASSPRKPIVLAFARLLEMTSCLRMPASIELAAVYRPLIMLPKPLDLSLTPQIEEHFHLAAGQIGVLGDAGAVHALGRQQED